MPNLKAIRKRIATVKNTRKITRAMKLMSAARLRRAQENITKLRPYALQTMDMIGSLAARADNDAEKHPLLARLESPTPARVREQVHRIRVVSLQHEGENAGVDLLVT